MSRRPVSHPRARPRTRDGTPVVPVTSPKLRTLLTVLLLDAGRVVSVEALKDALWGGAPPVSALPSLHNHVARLRRLLGEPGRLLTAPTGYVLRVDDGELDVQVFDAHVSAARSARAEGDWERVRRECRAALGLWRGMPLGGPPRWAGTPSCAAWRRRDCCSTSGATTPNSPWATKAWPTSCPSCPPWPPSIRCGRPTTVS